MSDELGCPICMDIKYNTTIKCERCYKKICIVCYVKMNDENIYICPFCRYDIMNLNSVDNIISDIAELLKNCNKCSELEKSFQKKYDELEKSFQKKYDELEKSFKKKCGEYKELKKNEIDNKILLEWENRLKKKESKLRYKDLELDNKFQLQMSEKTKINYVHNENMRLIQENLRLKKLLEKFN